MQDPDVLMLGRYEAADVAEIFSPVGRARAALAAYATFSETVTPQGVPADLDPMALTSEWARQETKARHEIEALVRALVALGGDPTRVHHRLTSSEVAEGMMATQLNQVSALCAARRRSLVFDLPVPPDVTWVWVCTHGAPAEAVPITQIQVAWDAVPPVPLITFPPGGRGPVGPGVRQTIQPYTRLAWAVAVLAQVSHLAWVAMFLRQMLATGRMDRTPTPGAIGSSSMPHKTENPWRLERVESARRLIRDQLGALADALVVVEAQDMSHSMSTKVAVELISHTWAGALDDLGYELGRLSWSTDTAHTPRPGSTFARTAELMSAGAPRDLARQAARRGDRTPRIAGPRIPGAGPFIEPNPTTGDD